jgi:aspartate ammonia-lyase
MNRTESDFLGEKHIAAEALYGIHSARARENFPDDTLFQLEWYKAVGTVKLACYQTYLRFVEAVAAKYPGMQEIPVQFIDKAVILHLVSAATEVASGEHFRHFVVPAVQGGAGTSINMNVNEIIANRALLLMGKKPGEYGIIDPIEHANVYQSTNDVIPTALKLAVMRQLEFLEKSINSLRQLVEEKESSARSTLRIGYTQMQEAVPSSYGRLFSTYNEALARDWWRVSKCFERIKTVNLGGSAIGTGMGVPRFVIMEVVQELQKISGLPLTRSENMQDNTANLDSFVEVHGILKAHAVNLEKMVSDLRLLASDLAGKAELSIPGRQTGSSIMPGKVNPVIPEFVISAAHKVYANDMLITSLSAQGVLDLNAYLPSIGHALLESLKLLIACDDTLRENLWDGLLIHDEQARKRLLFSPSLTTVLNPFIGYKLASQVAECMRKDACDIFTACDKTGVMTQSRLDEILKPENLLKTGFSIEDIKE